tara:strand:+ start:4391 stop:4591 length:201 start_codon:yes stop_codon:yes gene_type:complete
MSLNDYECDNEFVEKIVIDVCARKFVLYSDTGTRKKVVCETTEQFMDVLGVVTQHANPDLIKYCEI